jgi:hypothetical protein
VQAQATLSAEAQELEILENTSPRQALIAQVMNTGVNERTFARHLRQALFTCDSAMLRKMTQAFNQHALAARPSLAFQSFNPKRAAMGN